MRTNSFKISMLLQHKPTASGICGTRIEARNCNHIDIHEESVRSYWHSLQVGNLTAHKGIHIQEISEMGCLIRLSTLWANPTLLLVSISKIKVLSQPTL
jgi:hypothetical protein